MEHNHRASPWAILETSSLSQGSQFLTPSPKWKRKPPDLTEIDPYNIINIELKFEIKMGCISKSDTFKLNVDLTK